MYLKKAGKDVQACSGGALGRVHCTLSAREARAPARWGGIWGREASRRARGAAGLPRLLRRGRTPQSWADTFSMKNRSHVEKLLHASEKSDVEVR